MLQIPNGSNIRDICQFVGRRNKPNKLDPVFPCCVIKSAQTMIYRLDRHRWFLSEPKPPFLMRIGYLRMGWRLFNRNKLYPIKWIALIKFAVIRMREKGKLVGRLMRQFRNCSKYLTLKRISASANRGIVMKI